MGMNYYLVKKCEFCGHEDKMHIGKKSFGWVFYFRGYPDLKITSLEDWEKAIFDKFHEVVDEEGNVKCKKDFIAEIRFVDHENSLNIINIVMNTPTNEKEKEYLRKRNIIAEITYHKYWKDKEGFPFFEGEFS